MAIFSRPLLSKNAHPKNSRWGQLVQRAVIVFFPAVFFLGGCAGTGGQSLQEAVFDFTQGVRWGRHAYVTRHLAPASQQRYVAQRERLADLRVTQCRVASVRMASEKRAVVLLNLHWFRLSRGRVHATMVAQDWKRKGRAWRVVRQRVVRGAPLPIFPNPAASTSAFLSPGHS